MIHFKALLNLDDSALETVTVIDEDTLMDLQTRVEAVVIASGIFAELTEIRSRLTTAGVLASDRRYRQSLTVLKAAALLEGRDRVTPP